jgi:NAD(P)H-hydrate epimerase
MKILNVSQTRAADQYTIAHEPISSVALMERAATRATDHLLRHYQEGPFLVFCGPGNNGGDGLVMARQLAMQGHVVYVYTLQPHQKCSPDFQAQWKRLPRGRLSRYQLGEKAIWPGPRPDKGVVIDALLGSGLDRPLEGKLLKKVQEIKTLGLPVVAIDMPTGLPGDVHSGMEQWPLLPASLTLTFGHPKRGLLHPGTAPQAGRLEVVDIGLLPESYAQAESADYWFTAEEVASLYQARPPHSHKGSHGHAALLAGSPRKGGAAFLAAEACLRSGAGYTTAFLPSSLRDPAYARLPELMQVPPEELPAAKQLRFQAWGLGPGLAQTQETAERLAWLATEADVPQVWDADALNLLANHSEWLPHLADKALLTPHPGEWKRLLQGKDPFCWSLLRAYAQEHRVYVLLKNSINTLATPDGRLCFSQMGNAALAQAGSGDLLTGLLTGLLAQGYELETAAHLGLLLHGGIARKQVPTAQPGHLTSELLAGLSPLLAELGRPGRARKG